jgi:hypothetical protein
MVKGRSFDSLAAQNLLLSEWEQNVVDKRIHGATRREVGKLAQTAPSTDPLWNQFENAVGLAAKQDQFTRLWVRHPIRRR